MMHRYTKFGCKRFISKTVIQDLCPHCDLEDRNPTILHHTQVMMMHPIPSLVVHRLVVWTICSRQQFDRRTTNFVMGSIKMFAIT